MAGRTPFFRPRRAPRSGGDANPTPDSAAQAQARQFHDLILPYMDSAYNFARYLTRDPTVAEDVVQEAFLRAFRAFPDWRGEAPKAWLFAIVRNCFLTWAAGQAVAARVVVEEAALSDVQARALANSADPGLDTPEAALLRRHDVETIRAVIETLPEPFRETLVLRELEELSYKEIAVLTSSPIGTVMSRLARARQMLCEMLLPLADADAARAAIREVRR